MCRGITRGPPSRNAADSQIQCMCQLWRHRGHSNRVRHIIVQHADAAVQVTHDDVVYETACLGCLQAIQQLCHGIAREKRIPVNSRVGGAEVAASQTELACRHLNPDNPCRCITPHTHTTSKQRRTLTNQNSNSTGHRHALTLRTHTVVRCITRHRYVIASTGRKPSLNKSKKITVRVSRCHSMHARHRHTTSINTQNTSLLLLRRGSVYDAAAPAAAASPPASPWPLPGSSPSSITLPAGAGG